MSFLTPEDRDLFYSIYLDLMYWVNEKQKIVENFSHSQRPKGVDVGKVLQIREKTFDNPAWIDDYLCECRSEIAEEDQEILLSWRRHFTRETFYLMRHLKKYSVFMTDGNEDTARLYGVLGLSHPLFELIDKSNLPMMVKTIILPFKDQIVFDGLFEGYNIRFGPGIRSDLNHIYNTVKTRHGIIERLPVDEYIPIPVVSGAEKAKKEASVKSPQAIDKKLDEIAQLIQQFCSASLNEEFLDVCMHVLKKLSRKRPSPLVSGKERTWACGIVYAIASNNFVFDRSQDYYMTAQNIADGFGLSTSTAQNQAYKISKLLKINYFTPEYVIESLRNDKKGLISIMRCYSRI